MSRSVAAVGCALASPSATSLVTAPRHSGGFIQSPKSCPVPAPDGCQVTLASVVQNKSKASLLSQRCCCFFPSSDSAGAGAGLSLPFESNKHLQAPLPWPLLPQGPREVPQALATAPAPLQGGPTAPALPAHSGRAEAATAPGSREWHGGAQRPAGIHHWHVNFELLLIVGIYSLKLTT